MQNAPTHPPHAHPHMRLYEDDADLLMASEQFADRVSLVPSGSAGQDRVRIMWGQDMLHDLIDGRYRSMVCGVNDADNSHGIIAQLVDMIPASQWTAAGVTSFAKMFHSAASIHAPEDREPYVLKYDLDSLLILALLRPVGRDHFTLDDLARGFRTIGKMLVGRRERRPVASVSFLGARSNRLLGPDGKEPSFETVLHMMHESGFRGDVYPAPQMWRYGHVGVFPSYPYPEGLERMREGSS